VLIIYGMNNTSREVKQVPVPSPSFTFTLCFRIMLISLMGLIFGLQISFAQTQTYDEAAYQAYQAYRAQEYSKAADLLMEAARLKGTDNDTFFFDAATLYSQAKDSSKSLQALDAAVNAGLLDVHKVTSNPLLEPLKAFPEWKNLIAKLERNQRSYIATLKAPHLRDELLLMWTNDQRARLLLEQKRGKLQVDYSSPELASEFKQIKQTDSFNLRKIKEILQMQGWPAISSVGRDGAFAAWAIVQHSNDVRFQEKCLVAMKKALNRKEISPVEYAELHDRIRRKKYEKQLYGMAIRRRKEGPDFYPIAVESNLDHRRKLIGLEPSEVYARLNGFIYKPLSVEESKKRDRLNKVQAEKLIAQSKRAFTARNYKEAKTFFDEALSYYGDVPGEEIYQAAVRFAGLEKEPENYLDAVFNYLNILLNKGWNKKQLLIEEAAFKRLHPEMRWKELLTRF
jgi:hypothetical protein